MARSEFAPVIPPPPPKPPPIMARLDLPNEESPPEPPEPPDLYISSGVLDLSWFHVYVDLLLFVCDYLRCESPPHEPSSGELLVSAVNCTVHSTVSLDAACQFNKVGLAHYANLMGLEWPYLFYETKANHFSTVSASVAGHKLRSCSKTNPARKFLRLSIAHESWYQTLDRYIAPSFLIGVDLLPRKSFLKERSSISLSTFELKFSGFSNPVIYKSWLSPEFLNLYAILLSILSSYEFAQLVLGFTRVDLIGLVCFCSQRTCFRLMKSFPVSKPRNSSSYMDRGFLSSVLWVTPLVFMAVVLTLRALCDLEKVLGLKKARVLNFPLQFATIQCPVDGDIKIAGLSVVGCSMTKASGKVRCCSMYSNINFGSLAIMEELPTKPWNFFFILLLLCLKFLCCIPFVDDESRGCLIPSTCNLNSK